MLNNVTEILRPIRIMISGLFMIAALSACGILSSDERPSLNIETDREVYDINKDEQIVVTIENTSEVTIHYSTCLAKELEILDVGQLIDTLSFGVCYCLCPATLEPGEKVSHNISDISMGILQNKSDHLRLNDSLSYRLKYWFFEDEAWGDKQLPNMENRSNEFDLIVSDNNHEEKDIRIKKGTLFEI